MDAEKQISYWLTASELDWQTANDIFNSGKNLHFCLFLCHSAIEKILKAAIVKQTLDRPIKSHNLLRLAEIAGLKLTNNEVYLLQELNLFQLSSRYPDEKFTAFNIATNEYTTDKITIIKSFKEWLITNIKIL